MTFDQVVTLIIVPLVAAWVGAFLGAVATSRATAKAMQHDLAEGRRQRAADLERESRERLASVYGDFLGSIRKAETALEAAWQGSGSREGIVALVEHELAHVLLVGTAICRGRGYEVVKKLRALEIAVASHPYYPLEQRSMTFAGRRGELGPVSPAVAPVGHEVGHASQALFNARTAAAQIMRADLGITEPYSE